MNAIFRYPHIVLFFLSWFIADLIIPVLINISPTIGALDRPHSYKTHGRPVSFLGGIGIFIAFSVAIFSIVRFTGYQSNKPLFAITIASSFIVIIGAIDDFRSISALLKLGILGVVTGFLVSTGVKITMMPETLWPANFLLTLFWLAGVSSAMNSLDNTDGVAAGTTAIICVFAFLIAWKGFNYYDQPKWLRLQKWTSFASVALLGGTLGFLRYNLYKPRVFLGDNGSLFLGFLVGSLALLGGWSQGDSIRSFLVPCVLLTVPLYDITLSTYFRWRDGRVDNIAEAILYCGRDHLPHRLQALGFSKLESVFFLYLMGAAAGAVALFVSHPFVARTTYLIVAATGVVLLLVFGRLLGRAPIEENTERAKSA